MALFFSLRTGNTCMGKIFGKRYWNELQAKEEVLKKEHYAAQA